MDWRGTGKAQRRKEGGKANERGLGVDSVLVLVSSRREKCGYCSRKVDSCMVRMWAEKGMSGGGVGSYCRGFEYSGWLDVRVEADGEDKLVKACDLLQIVEQGSS